MPHGIRPALLAAVAAWSCAGDSTPIPTSPESAPPSAAPAGTAAPDQPPLDEATARRLLAAKFRAAGYRIVEDAEIDGTAGLALDGFDPGRGVGFEYIADDERDSAIAPADRERLAADPARRILIVDAAPAASLERAADQFLAGLPAPAPAR